MKTKKQIRDEVANNNGYIYWENIMRNFGERRITQYELQQLIDEVMELYGNEVKNFNLPAKNE